MNRKENAGKAPASGAVQPEPAPRGPPRDESKKQQKPTPPAEIDVLDVVAEASEESFPASDAPGWR